MSSIRLGKLESANDIKRQMRVLYGLWRNGKLGNDELRAGVNCLKEMNVVGRTDDIEARLAKLESKK